MFEKDIVAYMDPLYRTALRMTRSRSDAEDLVQEALLSAYRARQQFEPGTNLKAWLFKILSNTFINHYRKRTREQNLREQWSNELATDDTGTENLDSLFPHLLSSDLQAALDELPADYRIAVMLSDIEDFSYKEIADILECPIGTVMSRLYRGRALLRKRLTVTGQERGFGTDNIVALPSRQGSNS